MLSKVGPQTLASTPGLQCTLLWKPTIGSNRWQRIPFQARAYDRTLDHYFSSSLVDHGIRYGTGTMCFMKLKKVWLRDGLELVGVA